MEEQGGRELTGRRRELLEILPGLRRFALSLTGTVADADDLLQSTIERVLKRGLPIEAELMPWSVRVCRNLRIDEIRARKVRQTAASDPTLAGNSGRAGDDEVTTHIGLDEVQIALAELSDEQRAVLELVAVEGYSYREAAGILDLPIGTVMSRLARARGALIERCRPERPAPLKQKVTSRD